MHTKKVHITVRAKTLFAEPHRLSHQASSSTEAKMTVSGQPEAALSPLPKADGSATYSYAGYTITASANGPIEAQRRDEHPYEALVDVIVRPVAGVGGQCFGAKPHEDLSAHSFPYI